jgi:hypothetical protein
MEIILILGALAATIAIIAVKDDARQKKEVKEAESLFTLFEKRPVKKTAKKKAVKKAVKKSVKKPVKKAIKKKPITKKKKKASVYK